MKRWKEFAFNDVPLAIPDSWDLMKYSGNQGKGNFVLDDGDKARLDAQWGALAKFELATLEDKFVHKQKDLEVKRRFELGENQSLFLLKAGTDKLALTIIVEKELDRFIILRLLRPPKDLLLFVTTLTQAFSSPRTAECQRWEFFATAFDLPAGFILKGAALRTGSMKLEFVKKRRRLTIWDVSLLSQIEKRNGTRDFALDQVRVEHVKRFKFFKEEPDDDEDPAEFIRFGRKRWRWLLVNPLTLLCGQWRVGLQGIVNRNKNRFTILLYQYRRWQDLEWLGELPASFREAEAREC